VVLIPQKVVDWLTENGYGAQVASRPVSGGCINQGLILETKSGESFFLKTNTNSPADMFLREEQGLSVLQDGEGPRTPGVYQSGADYLLLEDLKPAPRGKGYWRDFGRKLAVLHKRTHTHFGFDDDNYIGSTPQSNPWTSDGYSFFGESRLIYQADLARQRGLFGAEVYKSVERLVNRLPDLVPVQPASLVHGDLWSGNAMTDASGGPAIIDPAAHYGWAEAELAMTALFGAFPSEFYGSYQEARPLDAGLKDRYPLYNLYHLLNHLNIFGVGYLGQVKAILRRFE